ncbi:MAG: serine/threonine-protein kinase, partial [Planctomycetota bacterium]
MALKIGTRLGPYEITAPIGAGGMGEVYRARDTRLDRTVAIKVLPEHLSKNTQARQRLEREARAVSSLNHPNICSLYDIGQWDGLFYLVLEHLEGQTLAARLGRGALPLEEALRYADQIADALHQAHRQGVVHRDLKPGNVMLTRSGSKLLDFGLSRSVETDPATSELTAMPTATSPLTAEGTVLGTLQYMSPEQLDGKPADVRSDIFAFGILLYEMVTGRRAFEGRTQASVIASIMKDQPRSISELAPMTPPALDRLVRTCLAKDPDDRRQSMRDVQLDLQWITKAETIEERHGARRPAPSVRGPWVLVAIMTLVAVVLGVMLMGRSDRGAEKSPVIRALIPPPQDTFFEFG